MDNTLTNITGLPYQQLQFICFIADRFLFYITAEITFNLERASMQKQTVMPNKHACSSTSPQ